MSPKKPSRFISAFFLFVIVSLSACARAPIPPAPTRPAPVVIVAATDTPEPTQTALPAATQVPAAATDTAVPTPTSTPVNELSDAKFFTSGNLSGWRYFITIESQKPIEGKYYAVVEDNKDYSCEIIAQFPKRLYCSGRLAIVDDYAHYVIYEKDTDRPVFSGKIFIPIPANGSNG